MHSTKTKRRAIALYDSGLSIRRVTAEIAKDLGSYVSPQTVARWVRERGKNRPVGESRSVDLPWTARQLYESGMNIAQVAERFRVGKTVAAKRLREMGTAIRPSGSLFCAAFTTNQLHEMYHVKGMRAQEIAKSMGCNPGTVYNWLRRRGIPLKRKRTRYGYQA